MGGVTFTQGMVVHGADADPKNAGQVEDDVVPLDPNAMQLL